MVDDNFSCIKEVTKSVHIALPSLYISNEIAGVTDVLESWKQQYIHQLRGVVVSYKNIMLTSNSGFIVIDKPFVHYDVKATFELFCPTVGSIVKGKINRVSHDYVGCLVHDTINVVIKLNDNDPDELSNFLVLDRMILCKITCFDFHRKVIHVKGEITDECIKLMKEIPSFNLLHNAFKNSKSTYYSSDLSDDTTFDVAKSTDEYNDATYEDSSLSQSFTAINYLVQNENSNVFNCDHLADGHGFSKSDDSDSSSSNIVPEKNKGLNNCDQTLQNRTELMDIDLVYKLPQKKKKKHKDKKSKKESTKRNSFCIKVEPLSDSTVLNENLRETSDNITRKKKKKSNKKTQKGLFNSSDNISGICTGTSNMLNVVIKEETTDSGYPSQTPEKEKHKSSKKSLAYVTKVKKDNHNIVNSLLSVEPCNNLFSSNIIKTEPKESKKRKHEPSDYDVLLKKKKKKTASKQQSDTKKDSPKKSNKKVKSKKKEKTDNSKKKDKKKKSKKHSISKKEKLSCKIKTKKSKKLENKSEN